MWDPPGRDSSSDSSYKQIHRYPRAILRHQQDFSVNPLAPPLRSHHDMAVFSDSIPTAGADSLGGLGIRTAAIFPGDRRGVGRVAVTAAMSPPSLSTEAARARDTMTPALMVTSLLLLLQSGASPAAEARDTADPGEPLFLTPLIEAGELQQARELSRVVGLPGAGANVTSHAGFFTVNKELNSNLFFWFFPCQQASPAEAPVVLWLQGGPGASSLYGLTPMTDAMTPMLT